MKNKFNLFIAALVLLWIGVMGVVAFQQVAPGSIIYWRPLNDRGYNIGTTVGLARPTAANSGHAPINGEGPSVLITAAGDQSPSVAYYSQNDSGWLANVTSTLATNAPSIVNSIWTGTNYIYAEGTADAYEMGITFADATADVNFQFRDDDADTYHISVTPDANISEAQFFLPQLPCDAGAAAEYANATDLHVLCYREYLPFPMLVTEIILYEFQATSAGSSDYLGAAIYEDADAGVQLTEGASVYAGDGAVLVIDVTDVQLEPDWYRFCATQNDISAQDWLAVAQTAAVTAIYNETVSEIRYGKATNDSTGNADMPALTGALASTAEEMVIMMVQSN